jgi:alkylation response protein AidB-like acyl-CoA dehydrogenase
VDNDLEIIRDQVKCYLEDVASSERLKGLLDVPGAFDRQLWSGAVEQGWPGLSAPEAVGGLGLGWMGLCVLTEELGRKSASLPLAAAAVAVRGLGEAARDVVSALVAGERIVCLAFSEAGEAGIPKQPTVTWNDGRVTGRKALTAFAAIADYAMVNAAAGDRTALLLVPLDQPGVAREILPSLDNGRAAAVLEFSGASAQLICEPAAGAATLRELSALAALATAFEQIGGAQRSMEMARDYALERIAFGQQIGRFQAIKHKVADMYWRIEVARGCALDAVAAVDGGDPNWPALAAAARVGATEAYEFAARENIQTHGGLGVTWEAMPQHYYRRSRALALELGCQAYWRDRLIEDAGFVAAKRT